MDIWIHKIEKTELPLRYRYKNHFNTHPSGEVTSEEGSLWESASSAPFISQSDSDCSTSVALTIRISALEFSIALKGDGKKPKI